VKSTVEWLRFLQTVNDSSASYRFSK
jgi:hypothetical protein